MRRTHAPPCCGGCRRAPAGARQPHLRVARASATGVDGARRPRARLSVALTIASASNATNLNLENSYLPLLVTLPNEAAGAKTDDRASPVVSSDFLHNRPNTPRYRLQTYKKPTFYGDCNNGVFCGRCNDLHCSCGNCEWGTWPNTRHPGLTDNVLSVILLARHAVVMALQDARRATEVVKPLQLVCTKVSFHVG